MFTIYANKFHPTLISNSYIPLLPQALIASKEEHFFNESKSTLASQIKLLSKTKNH